MKWEEVEHMLKKKDANLLVFEADQVIKRVDRMGDLFEPALKLKQKLPKFPGLERGAAGSAEAGLHISAQAAPRAASRKKTVKPSSPQKSVPKKSRKT